MQKSITVMISLDSIVEARKMYLEYTAAACDVDHIQSTNTTLHGLIWQLFPEGIPGGFMAELAPDGSYTIRVDIVRRLLDVLGLSGLITN